MSKTAKSSTEILEHLTTNHGIACRLIADLMRAIDHEKREQELQKDYPYYEVAGFDLGELDEVFGNTLENLSTTDATSPAFDHAGKVMQSFFQGLATKGYELSSCPLTDQEHIALMEKVVESGVTVELKDPGANSSYNHAFVGTVVSVKEGLVCVEDMDDDCFDVTLDEIDRVVD